MTVRLNKNHWTVDVQVNGHRVRRKSPINTELGARVYEAQLREELANGGPSGLASKHRSVASWAAEWMTTHCTTLNHSANGIRTKESVLRNHILPYFGHKQLDQVDTSAVDRFIQAQHRQGLSPKSINNHLAILGRMLRVAQEYDLLYDLPRMRRLPVQHKDIEFYSEEEVERLLGDVEEPVLNLMVRVGLRTGMRKGEIAALEWDCVNFDDSIIQVKRNIVKGIVGAPKSKKSRVLPMSRDVHDLLYDRRRARGLVFRRSERKIQWAPYRQATDYISTKMMSRAASRICARTGVRDLGWHALRHTFATQLIRRGVDIHQVCTLLGHSSITVTEKYLHVLGATLQGTVDLLLEDPAGRGSGSHLQGADPDLKLAVERMASALRAVRAMPRGRSTNCPNIGGILASPPTPRSLPDTQKEHQMN